MLAPALGLFALFTLYPFFYAAQISLTDWDGFADEPSFVGLDNYQDLLASSEFRNSLKVTALYTAGTTVFSLALGLALAIALNRKLRGGVAYRTIFFTPVVTATVAAAVVWMLLFDPFTGVVNVELQRIGVEGPRWLSDPDWALAAITIVGVWKRIGFAMIIYLAGLQTIPPSYYEAARVDGASDWQQFRHVTWPLLTSITVLQVVMAVIDSFQVFDHVFVMTGGGPLGATNVLPMLLYNEGFRLFHLGYASAIGWVIFLLVLSAALVQWRVSRGGGWRR